MSIVFLFLFLNRFCLLLYSSLWISVDFSTVYIYISGPCDVYHIEYIYICDDMKWYSSVAEWINTMMRGLSCYTEVNVLFCHKLIILCVCVYTYALFWCFIVYMFGALLGISWWRMLHPTQKKHKLEGKTHSEFLQGSHFFSRKIYGI